MRLNRLSSVSVAPPVSRPASRALQAEPTLSDTAPSIRSTRPSRALEATPPGFGRRHPDVCAKHRPNLSRKRARLGRDLSRSVEAPHLWPKQHPNLSSTPGCCVKPAQIQSTQPPNFCPYHPESARHGSSSAEMATPVETRSSSLVEAATSIGPKPSTSIGVQTRPHSCLHRPPPPPPEQVGTSRIRTSSGSVLLYTETPRVLLWVLG